MFFFTDEKLLDMQVFNIAEDNVSSSHYVVANKLQYHVLRTRFRLFQSSLPNHIFERSVNDKLKQN